MTTGQRSDDLTPLPGRVPRYRFDPEIDSEVRTLRQLDNWHGPLALIGDWVVIAAVVILCEQLSGWIWWLVYLSVALTVIATRQRALATLVHEAVHGTLAQHEGLNKFLGTWFSGYLILQPFEAFRRSHMRDHHGSFGDVRKDPDFRAHIAAGLYKPQSGATFVWRYMVLPLSGQQTSAIVKELRLSGTRDEALPGLAVTGYLAALGLLCWTIGYGPQFLLYWIVPLLFVLPLINWYMALLEHFPLVGNNNIDLQTTRHRVLGPVSYHFLGVHNEGYHLDHHLSPMIPYWNLPKVHEIRLRDPIYARVIEETAPKSKTVLWQFRDIVRQVSEGKTSTRLGQFTRIELIEQRDRQ
ncbi:fatty acid desaturase family protein [Nocardia beijingensis]|uniref:fatty acid desaturase family protein n=1 Tax=Nocardia beijingensis TaxID=95162 RepID=UPI0014716750|nr:fatty acid desaturase family protein [Nocardia beijingensis]